MEYSFASREEASLAAAQRIGANLIRRIDSDERAALVVSGGTTPGQCFSYLSQIDLDWSNVFVVPSDERWVPPHNDDSNEKQIRERLLQNFAVDAQLVPLVDMASDISSRCATLGEDLGRLPMPFACCLLGMGTDGHFASLFSDAVNLDEGLELDNSRFCIPVTTASSSHQRISLTLTALTRSEEVILLVFGEEKRQVYKQAKAGDVALPVTHLLQQQRVPVSVYWAP